MKFLKRLLRKRLPDLDLTAESSKAGNYFVAQRLKDAPIIEQTNALNYVAIGFYMGYRKLEEEMGIKDGISKRK